MNLEVIVVDNGSADGCGDMVAANFPQARFIQSKKNLGMGAGNNLGLRAASSKYVLIINPDIVILPGALAELYAFMETHPQAGAAGPRLNNPDGSLQPSCFLLPRFSTFLYRRTFLGETADGQEYLNRFMLADWDHLDARPVDWVIGAALIIRQDVLRKVGYFDERFFLFMEDVDLERRIKNTGSEIWYAASVKFIHYPHRLSGGNLSLKSLWQKTTWVHITSWLKYFWKWSKISA